MRKIFVYSGSRNRNSKSMRLIKEIEKELHEKFPECYEIEIYEPKTMKLSPCEGCTTCFFKGRCPIDKRNDDDSELLKAKLLAADFILLATPVYYHNVSSDMKCFMDRITYWTHLFRLAGKKGGYIISASSNGIMKVSDMMNSFMGTLGISLITSIELSDFSSLGPKDVEQFVSDINFSLSNEYKYEVDEEIQQIFESYQSVYLEQPVTFSEHKYWKSEKMFEFETLQEYIESKTQCKLKSM